MTSNLADNAAQEQGIFLHANKDQQPLNGQVPKTYQLVSSTGGTVEEFEGQDFVVFTNDIINGPIVFNTGGKRGNQNLYGKTIRTVFPYGTQSNVTVSYDPGDIFVSGIVGVSGTYLMAPQPLPWSFEISFVTATSCFISVFISATGAGNGLPPVGTVGQVLTVDAGSQPAWEDPIVQPNVSPARHITVGLSGANHDNLEDAIAEAILLLPVETAAVEIQMFPGEYVIQNPLTVPSYVLITSLSDSANGIVRIRGANVGAVGFEVASEGSVDGVRILSCNPAISATTGTVRVSNIVTDDVLTGFIAATNAILVASACTCVSRSAFVITGFTAITGGKIFATDIYCRNLGGTFNAGFRCDGLGSAMFLDNCNAVGTDNASITSDSGVMSFIGGRTINPADVGHFIQSGGKLNLTSHEILGTGSHLVIDATSSVIVQGCRVRSDQVEIAVGGILRGNFFSETPNDISTHIAGELSVGSVENPSESAFGGGDSYTRGMLVYHATNDGGTGTNFVDITPDVLIEDGTEVSTFSATTVGRILMIGSNFPFPGIKFIASLAAANVLEGNVSFQVSDGVGFTTAKLMSTQADAPYDSRGLSALEAGKFQYRFSDLPVQMTINSRSKYWVRFIITGASVTNGLVDQIKLHPLGRVEVNRDGFVELFNESSEISTFLPLNATEAVGDSPSDRDLFLDDSDTKVGLRENRFVSNVYDGVSTVLQLPSSTDTSKPLLFKIASVPFVNTSGNVKWGIRIAKVLDTLDDTPLSSLSDIYISTPNGLTNAPGLILGTSILQAIPVSRGEKLVSFEFEVDISSIICKRSTGSKSPDHIMFSFIRLGGDATDSYAGDIAVLSMNYVVKRWFV